MANLRPIKVPGMTVTFSSFPSGLSSVSVSDVVAMNTWILVGIPFLAASIGWGTNWLAIRMLFRPRRPIGWGRLVLQGLVPRRKAEMAQRLGQIVEQELLSRDLLRREIRKVDLQPHLESFTHRMVHEVLARKLRAIPLLGTMVHPQALAAVERALMRQLEKEGPEIVERMAAGMERQVNIQALVEEQILSFDLDRLEGVVRRVAHREFRAIEALGAVVGFLVGCLQVGLLLMPW